MRVAACCFACAHRVLAAMMGTWVLRLLLLPLLLLLQPLGRTHAIATSASCDDNTGCDEAGCDGAGCDGAG